MAQCATNLMFLNGQLPTRKLSRNGDVGSQSEVRGQVVNPEVMMRIGSGGITSDFPLFVKFT
jgi:hypothetical protein